MNFRNFNPLGNGFLSFGFDIIHLDLAYKTQMNTFNKILAVWKWIWVQFYWMDYECTTCIYNTCRSASHTWQGHGKISKFTWPHTMAKKFKIRKFVRCETTAKFQNSRAHNARNHGKISKFTCVQNHCKISKFTWSTVHLISPPLICGSN